MTGGTAQLGSGTLYRTIQKLLEDGLIEACGGAGDDDERRVPYRMTASGLNVARAEAQRLALLVKIAQRRRLIGAHATARRGAQL
jgi:DNA-binding PadR family transcriptional regulator